jgi:hypothetical protein
MFSDGDNPLWLITKCAFACLVMSETSITSFTKHGNAGLVSCMAKTPGEECSIRQEKASAAPQL